MSLIGEKNFAFMDTRVESGYKHDLEGYFESLAEQGFQNSASTKKLELAPPSRTLTF